MDERGDLSVITDPVYFIKDRYLYTTNFIEQFTNLITHTCTKHLVFCNKSFVKTLL